MAEHDKRLKKIEIKQAMQVGEKSNAATFWLRWGSLINYGIVAVVSALIAFGLAVFLHISAEI